MIETVKELRPDLVNSFEAMTHAELLNQIYLEVIDALDMEERVQIFMSECTDMSKTTYSPETIKTLIRDKQESNIKEWCKMTVEDSGGDDNYILQEVYNTAK